LIGVMGRGEWGGHYAKEARGHGRTSRTGYGKKGSGVSQRGGKRTRKYRTDCGMRDEKLGERAYGGGGVVPRRGGRDYDFASDLTGAAYGLGKKKIRSTSRKA